MAYFQRIASVCTDAMNDNGKKPSIRAGQAFMAAIADDPQAQQALSRTMLKLRAFATGIKLIGVTQRQVLDEFSRVFEAMNDALNQMATDHQQLIQDALAPLRADQERAFAELAKEMQKAQGEMLADLAAYGFDPPQDLEDWEGLARLVEKDPGGMTLLEIFDWSIAWAKREALRLKIARGETPIQAGEVAPTRTDETPPEDISIRRDEHDERIAWCMGKRIYLGKDSQISRLFWLLASPLGRARSLAEVQRAVDGFETDREMGTDDDGFKQASQRVRKAFSKLRQALREGEVDDHLLIVRGGSAAEPEYTMVLRYPK